MTSRTGRGPGHRDQSGAALVEFALIASLLILFICAIIDFGLTLGGYITMRSGVAAGARAASLGSDAYSGSATCTGGPNTATANMVCSVLSDVGTLVDVSGNSLAAGICFIAPGATGSGCSSESSTGSSLTQDVEVCAQVTLKSATGVTAPFLNGKTMSTASRLLIEEPQPSGSATPYDAYNTSSTEVVYGGTDVAGMNCP